MALLLSSDEEAEIEQISPIIGKRQIDIDEEIAFRPKRCKGWFDFKTKLIYI